MKDEKIFDKKTVLMQETIEETVGQDVPEKASKKTPTVNKDDRGIVVDCQLLNVRQTPSVDGKIVSVIPSGAKVKIETSKTTDQYYSISAKDGITGFCMKKFIKLY